MRPGQGHARADTLAPATDTLAPATDTLAQTRSRTLRTRSRSQGRRECEPSRASSPHLLRCSAPASGPDRIPDSHSVLADEGSVETPDSHPAVADEGSHRITVVGMCCVEGPTTSIPGEVVVGQPRGSNKNRGTSKGSSTRSEGRETGSSPGDVPVSRRRDDSLPSVAPRHPKHENADKHTETNMFPHILSPVCMHRIIYEHYVLSRFPQEFCVLEFLSVEVLPLELLHVDLPSSF